MSEEKKPSDPIYTHTLDGIEKQKLKIRIIEDTIQELKTNNKYKEYFSKYNPYSIDSFINLYAQRKADFVINGADYKKHYRYKCEQYIKEAKRYFPMIQQDKLLRLQYEWNEGNMPLKDIESNFDFYPLYDDVFNCKLISEVAQEDVDILSEYISINKDKDYLLYYHAHAYVNRAFENTPDSPDYEYNSLPPFHHFRTAKNFDKPLSIDSLIKAKKEEDYIDLSHAERRRMNPSNYEAQQPSEMRPWANHWKYEDVRKFIAKYEDQKTLLNYEAWYRAVLFDEDRRDKVNTAIWHFQENGENHPLKANDDWRDSIIEAAEKSKKEKIANALYLVYDEYLQNLKDKTPFMPVTEEMKEHNKIWEKYKVNVIQGRELCGEPKDFNF